MSQAVKQHYQALAARAAAVRDQGDASRSIVIQVGSATCEHAAGSLEVLDEFRKYVVATQRSDILLRQTGCTGRCSREPIVGILIPGQLPVKYERVSRPLVHEIFTSHVQKGVPLLDKILDGPVERLPRWELLVCSAARCGWRGKRVRERLEERLREAGMAADQVWVAAGSCFGACSDEEAGRCTHVLVRPDKVLYRIRSDEELEQVVRLHLRDGRLVEPLRVREGVVSQEFFELYGDVAFFNRQTRIALRHNGVLDPASIEDYLQHQGFAALAQALERSDPRWVIDEITRSRLRGRGGGGFPTGRKWAMAADSPDRTRYLICNADEGDPGAFMDRSMLESDPFNVLEGMMIAGFAIGARRSFVYVRAEYPLAIRRIENAIARCHEYGLLGRDILGAGFDFDIEIRLGAGAFVCGEETALIHSIEGARGQPRVRPPFPTESGLWGRPTVINNVETFANVPAILRFGADWFRRIGTEASGGTKVFALAGKVTHTGLVEVPMGSTLREVVQEIGGGPPGGKAIKAVQTGGPAGGCIPARMLDLPIDFDTLAQAGSIMGSGGMIVLDEADCMVDIARFFVKFSEDESCGKCTPCREGTKRMAEILDRITGGQGTLEDLQRLERLAWLIKKSSLCGLGRAAPNPVLSTLEHFRDEYLAHVTERRCPAKRCAALLQYYILEDKCTGCTACARNCPVECISGARRETHVIDQSRCVKCGRCFEVCRFHAVDRR